MPQEQQLSHRNIKNANIPYVSNLSPTSTDPCYVSGSTDILTSISGYAQRRPGFGAIVESAATTFHNPQRLFSWDRTDGRFILMVCDVNSSGFAQVYKFAFGTDSSFVSLFTDTSATPFDFVTSNNTVYFSNGNVAKKWDPVNGLSNWGIAIGSVNNATGPNTAGTGTNVVQTGNAWTNPGNVTSAVSFATATFSGTNPGVSGSDYLQATNFAFAIPASSKILGIQVAFDAKVSAVHGLAEAIWVNLIKNGSIVGSVPFHVVTPLTTGAVTYTVGGNSDLWSSTWTPNDVNGSTFGVNIQAVIANAFVTDTFSVRNVKVTIFGLGGPSVSTVGTGSFNSYVGYQYVFTYGNSNTGHISSPSPVSSVVGPFGGAISSSVVAAGGKGYAAGDTGIISAGNFNATYTVNTVTGGAVTTYTISAAGTGYAVANNVPTAVGGTQPGVGTGFTINISAVTGIDHVQVSLTASNDTQVNQIHVYRSTDSVAPGTTAAVYFELPNSPFANSTGNINDNAADNALIVTSIAPTAGFNDPPTPGQCAVYFSGRIWLFSGSKVYFSGLEEIIAGVPEESFPSGIAGNFWGFDEPPQALAVAGQANDQTMLTFCGGRVFGITGNSLDTFRRFVISTRRGCRNIKAVSSMGGMVAWRDSSGQVWVTDGSSMNEVSLPIRPDLTPYTPGADSVAFHASGNQHWLLVSTGTQIFTYDLDTEQWMPPWTHNTNLLYSGESAAGSYQLFSADTTGVITKLTSSANNFDLDVTQTHLFYTPIFKLSNMALVPDFGSRFSAAALSFYDEPSRTGYPSAFQIDMDASSIGDVLFLADDDPLNTGSTYASISAQNSTPQTSWNRGQGTFLVQNVFRVTKPASRWVSWQVKGQAVNDTFKVYGFFMAYKEIR